MNKNEINSEETIDLFDIVKYLRKYYKLVVIATIAGLVVGLVLTVASFMRGEMSKKYLIKTSIAVTSQTADGLFTSQSANPNSTDIHLAEDMVDSVIFVIKSDRTLEKAVDELQLIGITAKDISDNLVLSQYNKTQIIDISLYWRNAEEGIKILEAINEVCPKILVDILKIGDVRVVNDPTAKYLIGGSIRASIWAMMALGGLAVGIGLVVLLMLIRPTLITCSDAENKLGLKLIGVIPEVAQYPVKESLFNDGPVLGREANDAYLSAAHILRRTLDNLGYHFIYLTSTGRQEGKSAVTANLGIHLAELEKKVLLIDMDLESPNLGGRFLDEVVYDNSLNAVYSGDVPLDEAIVPVSGYLHILPLIHDRKDIVVNDAMLDMIKAKAAEYDYVLVDTSPVGDTAEILRLNRIADGALMVIKYDREPLAAINEALTRLKKTEIPVIGCVINRCTELGRK